MKIGLIGINNLNQEEHFNSIRQASNKGLCAFFSHSEEALPISAKYNIKLYRSTNELFEHVDAVYFANSLKTNLDFALSALKRSCHLFIEDISELTIEEMKHLYKVAFEARTKIQLKLTKAFTPEYIEVRDDLTDPKLIEINKSYTKFLRYNDYFLEVLNNLFFAYQNIKSSVKKISTFALPTDKNLFSTVHIRLDYDNGALVNIKLNCIANDKESKVSFYEKDRIIQIDFIKHFAIKHKFEDGQVKRHEFNVPNETAFDTEMLNFINSCQNLDMQNISESPTELKLIQVAHEIKERLIQASQPK